MLRVGIDKWLFPLSDIDKIHFKNKHFWSFLGDPKYNEGSAAIEVFNLCNDNEWLAWHVVFPTASDTQVEKRGILIMDTKVMKIPTGADSFIYAGVRKWKPISMK